MFKTTDFESLDVETQMDIVDKLGIIGVKNDVKAILKRLDALEQHSEELEGISHWRDNIITADEAFNQVKEKEEACIPSELNKAFKEIHEAIDNEQSSVGLYEYECDYDSWGLSYIRKYHLNNLMRLLPNYKYSVEMHEGDKLHNSYVLVSWDKHQKASIPKIDPDKKYILPMEGTDWIDKGVRHYATIHENYWEPLKWTGGVLPPYGPLYEVQGKDILNAPDWVKAIKPIEVKE